MRYNRISHTIVPSEFVSDFCAAFSTTTCPLVTFIISLCSPSMTSTLGLEANFTPFSGISISIFSIRGLVTFCFSTINGLTKPFVELLFGGMIRISWICGTPSFNFGFTRIVYFASRGLGPEAGATRSACNSETSGASSAFAVAFFRSMSVAVELTPSSLVS